MPQNAIVRMLRPSEVEAVLALSHEQVESLPWFDPVQKLDWAESVAIAFGQLCYGVNAVDGKLCKTLG